MVVILKVAFWNRFFFQEKWCFSLRILLMAILHWFRWWLGTEQVTCHFLNQNRFSVSLTVPNYLEGRMHSLWILHISSDTLFTPWLISCWATVVESIHLKTKHLLSQDSQCYGCWWPGDARSQDISSYGIDLVVLQYCSFNTRRVNASQLFFILLFIHCVNKWSQRKKLSCILKKLVFLDIQLTYI